VLLEDVQEEWEDAYFEILDTLYREATPGLDYSELDPGDAVRDSPPTYLRHYLDAERQEELVEEVLDDYSIPEDLYFDAKKAVFLSKGPSASLETVDSAREEADLEPVTEMLEEGDGSAF
jgi:hypothetical protein